MVPAALCAAALMTWGCRGGSSGSGSGAAAGPAAAPGRVVLDDNSLALKRGDVPREVQGGFAQLLADLSSGEILRALTAEERLRELGVDAAPCVRAAFGSGSPEARAAACRLAYRIGDPAFIPPLVARLGDESRLVRIEANVNLCGLTGQDFNFRADALESDRAEAIKRWEAWYARTYGPVKPGRSGSRR
jgi:hypothetical protein